MALYRPQYNRGDVLSPSDLQGDEMSSQVITRAGARLAHTPVAANRHIPVEMRDTYEHEEEVYAASSKLKVPALRMPRISPKNRAILFLALGAIALLVILQIVSFVNNWYIDLNNTYSYGPTRTSAASVVLGLDGDSAANPSLVQVTNLQGNIIVTILPAGDGAKLQSYNVGYHLLGDNASKQPVTFQVDRTGDIQLHISGQTPLIMLTKSNNKYVVSGN